jgi:hypothetical protein
MRGPVLDLRIILQKLRRAADDPAVRLDRACANSRVSFGTAACEAMGDEKDVGACASACRDQAISAAAFMMRPSADSPAATMLLASSPAISYICSGPA